MEQLTLESFKQKICECGLSGGEPKWEFKGARPAVIDFYADWCGPCKLVAPIMEQLSQEYAGKVDFYTVDTEAQQDLAAMFGITSIPSILFIPLDGKPQMTAGAAPKKQFQNMIREVFGIAPPGATA
jgi:thioredoxin